MDDRLRLLPGTSPATPRWRWTWLILIAALTLCGGNLSAQKIEDPDVVHNRMLQHEQDGEAKLKAKDYKTALAYLALALRDAETLAPTYVDHAEYGPLYRELKGYYKDRIATVYMLMEDNPRALAMIEKAAPEYDALLAVKNTLELRERTAAVYGRLSYQQLLANQPANAKTSAKRALRLDPTQLWIKTNLAHGMLLTGEVQEAMTIYKGEQNSALGDSDNRTFGQAVLDDFKEMEAAGVKSPLFDQVRRAYGASAPAPAPTPQTPTPAPPTPTPPKTAIQTPPPSVPTPTVTPASESPAPPSAPKKTAKQRNPVLFGFIFIGTGVIIALVAVLIIYFEKKRTGALKSLVDSMGWIFRPNSTPADNQLISSSELSMRGRNRKLSNFIELPPGPGQPLIFDCQFIEGTGKGSRTYTQTVCCFQDERTRMLPHFLLRPEHLGDKLGSLFGGKDINFPSHPEFSTKYLLRGMNETAIRQYFTQALLDHFDRDRGWTVEAVSGRLFVYRLDQRIKPQELQSFIDSRRKILAVITAPVTSTATASSSSLTPPPMPTAGTTVSAEADLDSDVTIRGTRPPSLPS